MWRIQESHPVSSIGLHPSGGFVLVGSSHPVLRLYDLNTMKAFASQNAGEHHQAPITKVRYSPDGTLYASGCKAGVLKLWDGRSNRVVNTFTEQFDTNPIGSIQFSASGQ
jgi:cleavage stimulation factor subunit 1